MPADTFHLPVRDESAVIMHLPIGRACGAAGAISVRIPMARGSPVGLGFYFQQSVLTSDERRRHRRIYHQNCVNFSGNEV